MILLLEVSGFVYYSLIIRKYSLKVGGFLSFKEEKRESIKRYMLEKIRLDDRAFLEKTTENFQISVTTVKRYIKECLEKGILAKSVNAVSGFKLVVFEKSWALVNNGELEEDRLYFEEIEPLLKELPENVRNIWYYAFAEIMNNAIEHSRGDKIDCTIRSDYLYTEISVLDNGIGVFKSIREYADRCLNMKMDTMQAMTELYKGKFTTNPESHSGEGIFFASKMLTSFALLSEDTIYSYQCADKDRFVKSHLIAYYTGLRRIGTMAVMKMDNNTRRTSQEVFDRFAPIDEGFAKTLLPMRELCPFGDPVARSHARRILQRLEQFQEVVFDFEGIEFMGQGFADEVFRVFQNRFPEVKLTVINANRRVAGMVKHVTMRNSEF